MTELCEYQIEVYNDLGAREINDELLIFKETMAQKSFTWFALFVSKNY